LDTYAMRAPSRTGNANHRQRGEIGGPSVSLYFRSLRSSSAGNCVQIWTQNSQIIIDCGFKTQWECEEVLSEHAGSLEDLDAVLVTHVHGDHIG
jgi:glyoxylase-like metal-dependent hydrolase (beta-lactamase superfamily II)